MTIRSFGRTVPIHHDMLSLVGYEFANRDLQPATSENARKRAMRTGLHSLKKQTGADFGYDVQAWRSFLIGRGDEFGYTHPYAFSGVDKAVQAATADPDVIEALSQLADDR